MIDARSIRAFAVITLLFFALAGCGPMPEPASPTPPPTAAAPTSAPATPATPKPATPTLGELATRLASAWAGVTSYEVTFTGGSVFAPVGGTPVAAGTPVAGTPLATPGATPVARQASTFTSVRQVVLPDRQRQVISGLGTQDQEAIVVGGRLFVRGPVARQIDPGAAEDVWLSLDAARVPAGSVLSGLLGGLPTLPPSPLAAIPQRLLSQPLRDLGSVEFDGRSCHVYGAVDTAAATGMRIDRSIAVDADDIPCFIETSTGGKVQGREEFRQINASLAIAAPAAATPVAVPPALATPAVHD